MNIDAELYLIDKQPNEMTASCIKTDLETDGFPYQTLDPSS